MKNFISSHKIFYFLESFDKWTFFTIGELFDFGKEGLGKSCRSAVFFCNKNELVDELFLSDIAWFFRFCVESEVLIEPHSPLGVTADRYHLVIRLKAAEYVQEYVIANHHFFEQIDDLSKRQTPYVRQSALEALDYHLHSQIS